MNPRTEISLVTATAAGRQLAQRLASAWPGRTAVHSGSVAEQMAAAWRDSDALVCFLATGAAVRLAAPLLSDKHHDPGLVCVDEAARFAVAVLGGHAGGANALAAEVAAVLGAQPVVTTATDATGVGPLDTFGADLGFRLADRAPVARVTAAMLDGASINLAADAVWPTPPLPIGASGDQVGMGQVGMGLSERPEPYRLTISDRVAATGDLVYRPASLVVGVGASRAVAADEVDDLICSALAEAGLAIESVRALSTVDVKADEDGIIEAARRHGWPVLTHPAEVLASEEVPNPSEVVRAAVGTPSVAEAAALVGARTHGRGAALVVPKRASAMATVAVARLVPRGRLTIVGLGPGAADLRTPRAVAALRRAAVVVGLDQYVDQIRHLLTVGTRVVDSGLGDEEKRARTAVELATEGHAVALIGSGDAGVYAMASPALQVAGEDVDIEAVPGITAALAAASLLGAPLGHDHAYLSLSDLHTPWAVIADRLRACAAADLVVCLYNPRSLKRIDQFSEALLILGAHRPAQTPVGVVREATRADQRVTVTTLGELTADPSIVDMRSVVLVGSSRTTVVAGRIVTPREYRWLP